MGFILIKACNHLEYPFLNYQLIKHEFWRWDKYVEFENLEDSKYYIYCDMTWDESSS